LQGLTKWKHLQITWLEKVDQR